MRLLSFKLIFLLFYFSFNKQLKSQNYALISSHSFSNLIVITALDDESKKIGLMGVKELDGYNGMLFIYDKPKKVNIWMYNTFIPLDIIFIDEKRRIVSIEEGSPNNVKLISSRVKVIAVLEIPFGCAKKLDLKPGDILKWKDSNIYKIEDIRYFHCLQDKEKIE